MISLGYPYIHGYKPRSNVQSILFDVVEEQVQGDAILQEAAQSAVLRPAIANAIENPTSIWVPAPVRKRVREVQATYAPKYSAARRDYLAQEARNRSLGRAGELFVAELESRRLHAAGKLALSRRIEHVSATRGDGLGYDVLSYEENGCERLIEVKTTAFGNLTPFFISRNELARSESDSDRYHLYRLFDFRDRPRLFSLPGEVAKHCCLNPVTFFAQLN